MSLPRYPEYKDSGIAWLGEVPEHWEVKPIKAVASCNDAVLEEATPEDFEIEYVEISGVQSGCGITATETMPFGKAPSRARRCVADGDVLVSTVRTYLRAIAPVINPPSNLIVSTGFAVVRPRLVVPHYLGYLFQAEYLISEVIARSVGVSYPAINASELMRLNAPIPSEDEQQTIAAFLDRETGKIDALIAEQQRLVELLAEKRQAVISHAVTKGLNPNARMKDSGIEWLGEVPEHWAVIPFKKAIDFQEGPGIMAADFYDEGIPLLRVSGVQGRWASLDGCNFLDPAKVEKQWNHFRLTLGDLLISASASMGTVCEVNEQTVGAIPYTGLIRLRGKDGVMTRSFVRSLVISYIFSTQIDLLKAGSTIQHFGPTHLSQMKVVCPSVDEQEEISGFVDTETAKFDTLTAEANRAIALLQERRSALISAAVTGKIDVRTFVASSQAGEGKALEAA